MQAIAKIILFGEHSVVYGKKALALPIKELKIRVEKRSKKCFKEEDEHVEYIKKLLNIKEFIKIKSNIPISRGLGSSAALSVALARMQGADVFEISKLAEIKAHGNPSGIDSAVIIHEKAIIFEKNKEIQYIDVNLNAYIVIIDSGIKSSTKEAVEKVKKLNRMDLIENLGKITENAITKIYDKDIYALGKMMKYAQNNLKNLKLSTPFIDRIIRKANYNSLGAKITGSGLGGCVIALCKNKLQAKKLTKNLKKEGVKNFWIVKV